MTELERLESMNQAKLDTIHELMTEVDELRGKNKELFEQNCRLCRRNGELDVLLKEQKAEIERLTAEANRYKRYYFNHEYDKIKSEARKEFVERVKKRAASRTYAQIWDSDLDEVIVEMEERE